MQSLRYLILFLSLVLICFGAQSLYAQTDNNAGKQSQRGQAWDAFEFAELDAKRAESQRPWLQFLKVPTLSTGLYVLKAGSDDRQPVHDEDEVYYIASGHAVLKVGTEDQQVKPGSIVFVKAGVPHRFHSIKEDLKVLVFFSAAKSEPEKTQQSQAAPQFELDQYQFGLLSRGPNYTSEKTPETEKIQAGHMAHMTVMAQTGKFVAAGPIGDDGDLRGIYLFHVASAEEAKALAADDPAIKAGRLKLDLITWWGPKGIGEKFLDEYRRNPKLTGTMTKYYLALLRKGDQAGGSAQLQSEHLWHIRQMMDAGKMPLAGPFENGGDLRGIFVIAADSPEAARAVIAADPAVKAGHLKPEIHPWYVAKEVMP